METRSNHDVVQRYFEEFIAGNQSHLADEMMTGNMFYRGPINVVQGLGAVKGWLKEWKDAFPDCAYAVEYVVSEGDYAMCRTVMRGTHKDTFRGVPATGRRVTIPTAFSFRFEGPKIGEIEAFYDTRLLFEQLGTELPPALKFSKD